jgi:signal transduction histidine kinase
MTLRTAMTAHLTVTDNPLHDPLTAFSRLINELATAHRDLAKQNAELETAHRELANRNSELAIADTQKNIFFGMVAHDLRNPLGVIMACGELLKESTGERLTPQECRFLEVIVHSSEFMSSIVNDLLDVAKIESGTLTLHSVPANILSLLIDVIELSRLLALKKKIAIEFQDERSFGSANHVPLLMLDLHKCEQVFNNLIGNAVKYSPPGSTIRVRITSDKNWVSVSVADNGPGISAKDLETITNPFKTAGLGSTQSGKSTGLGLAIVKRILEGHGGRLTIVSQPDAGSEFTAHFPIT